MLFSRQFTRSAKAEATPGMRTEKVCKWLLVLFVGITLNVAEADNSQWRVLGNGAEVQHYSPLDKINDKNVSSLDLAWSVDIPSRDGLVGNPLVADGLVYQSGPGARVYVNDVRTGKAVWKFDPAYARDKGLSLAGMWSSLYNRGLALLDDKVFVAAGDCRLRALNRHSGKLIWTVQSCDPSELYGITGAPRVGAGLVFIGNNCIDSGQTRGYVDAFDAVTGKRRWRFYTVPGDPAKGFENEVMKMAAETWGTDWYSKSRGCGSVWDAMTYDPELNLLYIGTAGPAPWDPGARAADAGDELFTNSIVALRADTGEYVWHFKQTPHDGWNFDANMQLMIAELPVDGELRRVVMQSPKNGFFYVLDAKTGKFISANNFVPLTWASGIDPKSGRPFVKPEAQYWKRSQVEIITSPGALGASNWQAMALNPATGLVYFSAWETPTKMVKDPEFIAGGFRFDMYYGLRGDPNWQTAGYLIAWDPVRQEQRWRVKQELPLNGGVLSTAGNLIFQGQANGSFSAYAANSGELLWSYDAGTSIMAAPATVDIDGEQLILVPSGNSASASIGPYTAKLSSKPVTRGPSRLLAFKLGGKAELPKFSVTPIPRPPLPQMSNELAEQGRIIYEQNFCADCHGLDVVSSGGTIVDLRRARASTYEQLPVIVIGGLRKGRGMPNFPDITMDELKAIQAYILREAWSAYNNE